MTQDKKKATGRHMNLTPEFRSEAVRLVMNSGRSAREIASDLGIGHSTLNKWVSAHKEKDLVRLSAGCRNATETERLTRAFKRYCSRARIEIVRHLWS